MDLNINQKMSNRALTLKLPQMTMTEFLLTIQYQVEK